MDERDDDDDAFPSASSLSEEEEMSFILPISRELFPQTSRAATCMRKMSSTYTERNYERRKSQHFYNFTEYRVMSFVRPVNSVLYLGFFSICGSDF